MSLGPTFVGATVSGSGSLAMPAGFRPFDLLALLNVTRPYPPPAGWTAFGYDTSGSAWGSAAWRIADGTETTVPVNGSIAAYRQANAPLVTNGNWPATAGVAPYPLPALSVPYPLYMIAGMFLAYGFGDTFAWDTNAPYANITQDYNQNNGTTSGSWWFLWGHTTTPVSGSQQAAASEVGTGGHVNWGQSFALRSPAVQSAMLL